jgi:opacity protein-like surface antigen
MRRLLLLAALAAPAFLSAQSDDASRVERNAFTWQGRLPAGRWLYVKNLNGPIRVEAASGDEAVVTADRLARGDADPRQVRFVVQKADDGEGVVICALWGAESSCDQRGYHSDQHDREGEWHRGSVTAEFTVRVPRGVNVDLATVNGGLDVRGATAEVVARTVNGSVRAETGGGPVRATTVNGSVWARMASVGDARDLEFASVNGSVTVEVPASLGAEVELSTVSGRVGTEFPLTVTGRIDPRRLRATIGDGSRHVRLRTVNGNVDLRRAG